jgi:hypothetical protein
MPNSILVENAGIGLFLAAFDALKRKASIAEALPFLNTTNYGAFDTRRRCGRAQLENDARWRTA